MSSFEQLSGIPAGEIQLVMSNTSFGKSQVVSSRDKIEQHLIKQKARAATAGGSCRYRTEDGLMCAVGCLIADDDYNEETMESKGVGVFADTHKGLLPTDISLRELEAWQAYHDSRFYGYEMSSYKPSVEFDYRNWINGDEAHSPTKFKAYLATKFPDSIECPQ